MYIDDAPFIYLFILSFVHQQYQKAKVQAQTRPRGGTHAIPIPRTPVLITSNKYQALSRSAILENV